MDEQKLFHGALEAILISAQHVPGEGWTCTFRMRRQFEDWQEGHAELYERLTTPELMDTMWAMVDVASREAGL